VSLQAILEAIRADGLARVQEVERRAQAEAGEMLAVARVEAQRLRQQERAAEVGPVASECARIIQGARLEGLRIVGQEREMLVAAAFQQARDQLSSMRADRAYPGVLRRLTEEALGELGGSAEESVQPSLAADPRDQAALESVVHALGVQLAVQYRLDCLGGIVAQSQDGRVIAVNTLEARLARAEPFLRRRLGALFEEGQSESKAGRVRSAVEV
jgi:vacuolar-type H+-ATPase subunit E/Vma4